MKNIETEAKKQKTYNKNKDKKITEKNKLINEIQIETKETLLPAIQKKMNDVVDFVVNTIGEKEGNMNSNQIMSLLARKSLSEIAMSSYNVSYTPQEIAVAFNIYLDMIDKINQVKKFPPTIHSFTTLLGITSETFENWKVDPEKREIANYINSYFIGAINTSTLIKEVEVIAGIYTTKTMGLIEKQAPVVVEHKKTTDVDDIQRQLEALKRDNVIEAEYEDAKNE